MTSPPAVPRSLDAAEEPPKSMMPTIRKRYIVLRATFLLRKDSL
jgi:hypothetical protein